MINKYVAGICLALLSSWSSAQGCNRAHSDWGDYVQPWEFCDDDLGRHKLPGFGDYPADQMAGFKPVMPKRVDGSDAEYDAAWMEAIREAYKSRDALFAGHYLLVQRGACGNGGHRALIVDLQDGKVYEPEQIGMVFATLNSLPESMCKKLGIAYPDETLTFRPNSKLLLMIGQQGEEAKRRGLYYYKWEANKLTLVSKIDKSLNEGRQRRAK